MEKKKRTMWHRTCPECKAELTYYSRQNLWRANKNKCLCASCAKTGIRNPTKQEWVKKKIGKSGTKYNLPDQVELTCKCGNKWSIGKRNYIFYYLNPGKSPRCSFCINRDIASHISMKTKKLRSIKMSKIMTGRKILWSNKINDTWDKKSKKDKMEIYKKISETHSRLIAEGKIKFNSGYKSGYHKSNKTGNVEYYHSSWELNKMKMLDVSSNVLWWTKSHKIRIPYTHNNVVHYYVPDFLIKLTGDKTVLEEVKGYIKDHFIFKLKCKAAKVYCRENNIEYKISYDNCSKN